MTLVITTHYMDEAEQLCDRLAVMDRGRFAAEGTPRQLIDRYSTKEVVELRFAPGEQESAARAARRRWPTGPRCCPTGVLLYTADGDATLAAGARARAHSRERPGAPFHARGRVPPPDRPHPRGLSPGADDHDRRGDRGGRRPTPDVPGGVAHPWRRPTPLWLRAHELLGLPVQADLAVVDHHQLPLPRPLPGRHGGRAGVARRQAHPPGRRVSRTSTSWHRGCWPPPPCRSAPTRPCTR